MTMASCHNVVTNLLQLSLKSSVMSHQTWHQPICLKDCGRDCICIDNWWPTFEKVTIEIANELTYEI